MATALANPRRVSCLGVVDISPAYTTQQLKDDPENPRYEVHALLKLLNAVPLHQLGSRREVEMWMLENHSRPLSNVSCVSLYRRLCY